MRVADEIRAQLTAELAPAHVEVVDDSAKHAGHAGSRPEGETHFSLTVVADIFVGRSRLERQRMVNAALAALLATRVHALAMRTLTPDEWRTQDG